MKPLVCSKPVLWHPPLLDWFPLVLSSPVIEGGGAGSEYSRPQTQFVAANGPSIEGCSVVPGRLVAMFLESLFCFRMFTFNVSECSHSMFQNVHIQCSRMFTFNVQSGLQKTWPSTITESLYRDDLQLQLGALPLRSIRNTPELVAHSNR